MVGYNDQECEESSKSEVKLRRRNVDMKRRYHLDLA